jgi:hypothetical protein
MTKSSRLRGSLTQVVSMVSPCEVLPQSSAPPSSTALYFNVSRISGKYPLRAVDDEASRTRMRIVWPGFTLRSA